MLKPFVYEEFNGTTLPAGWDDFIGMPGTSGSVTVANGLLTVDGGNAGTTAVFGPGHVVEATAIFTASPNQHVGFGVNHTGQYRRCVGDHQHRVITALNYMLEPITALALLTRSLRRSGSVTWAPLTACRIDWQANQVIYSIDGTVVATHNVTIPIQMRPLGL